jgi:hypothetical protein
MELKAAVEDIQDLEELEERRKRKRKGDATDPPRKRPRKVKGAHPD